MSEFRLFLHHAPATLVVPALLVACVGWRLIGPSSLRGRARRVAWMATVVPWLWVMLAVMFWREQEVAHLSPLVVSGFFVLGWLMTLCFLLLAKDLVVLLGRASTAALRKTRARFGCLGPTRINALIVVAATAIAVLGSLEAMRPPQLRRVTLRLPRLPKSFSGYRVVQISDVHAARARDRPRLIRLVDRVKALDADLIALTGDLVDGPLDNLRATLAPLAALRAADGVYFVVGNHEFYADADACVDELRRLGIAVLLNDHRLVQRGTSKLLIAGVTHPRRGMHGTRWVNNAGWVASLDPDPKAALQGAPPSAFRLLLAHHPATADAAAAAGYDLMLCGHTHGGQFFPWSLFAPLVLPRVAGLYRKGSLRIYVSRGVGTFGPPSRLGVPPEIDLLELR